MNLFRGSVKNWRAHYVRYPSNIWSSFLSNSNSWINSIASHEGIHRRFDSSVALARCDVRANSTSGKSLNHKRSRRRLFRKRAENQGFRHESSRKLGWMVEGFARNPTGMRFVRYSWFSFPPSCLRLETSDSVIDIRVFPCPSCFSLGLIASSFPWFHFRRALCFPDCFPDGILFRKNTRILRIYRPVSPSGFPFFIVSSPAAIAIFASAAKRTTSLRHPLSPVYVIFSWSHLAVPLFGYLGIGLWLSFHEIKSERLRQHLYLLNRFSVTFFFFFLDIRV